MKRTLPAILAAFAVSAGVFAFVQYSGTASLRQQIADSAAAREAAQKATQTAEAELACVRAESDLAKENIARLTAERDAALTHAKSAPVAGTLPGVPLPPKVP